MANPTQDTTDEKSEDALDQDEIETSQEEDETTENDASDDESEETEDSDEEDDDSDDSDEEETEEDDDSEFEKRFTQFKGDSYEEYTPQLEKAYGDLQAEFTRFKQSAKEDTSSLDTIRQAVTKDPEFAKKLNELLDGKAETVIADPALLHARQQLEEQMDKDYKNFLDLHPELESDPTITQKVFDTVKEFGEQSRKQGKIMGMAEALRKAWAYHGLDDAKEKVIVKAKENASKSKTGNKAKKTASKTDKYTSEQRTYAKKWGLTLDE